MHLTGDDWLVETDDRSSTDTRFYVARGSAATAVPRAMLAPVVLDAQFEPSTKLLTTTSHDGRRALRYDPDAHELRTEPALLHHPFAPSRGTAMAPLAPELAGGMQLAIVEHGDTDLVRWYGDDAETQLAGKLRVESVLAVDHAGHVFAFDHDAIGVYDHGETRRAALPRRQTSSIVANRDGSRIAQVAIDGVYVDDLSGQPVWHAPMLALIYPVWLDDGALAVPTHSGLVRLDGHTGAVTAMRCGWSFGRRAKPGRQPPAGESMCELVARGQPPWPPPLQEAIEQGTIDIGP